MKRVEAAIRMKTSSIVDSLSFCTNYPPKQQDVTNI